MRSLEQRLEKLEQASTPAEVEVLMLIDWGEGELKGWKGDGFYITRLPGEPEGAFDQRAYAEAKAYGEAHPSLLCGGLIIVQIDREHVPYVRTEPRPRADIRRESRT